jgi:hypothetical protein
MKPLIFVFLTTFLENSFLYVQRENSSSAIARSLRMDRASRSLAVHDALADESLRCAYACVLTLTHISFPVC